MGAGAPLLGVVANGLKSGRRGSYGYGYSYDYAASGADTKAEAAAASTNGASGSEETAPVAKA